jgi:hypothetical protein
MYKKYNVDENSYQAETYLDKKLKVSHNRPKWPKGFQVGFSTFGTTRVVGRQPYALAAFTPGEIPGIHF